MNSLFLACSGPGARVTIAENVAYSQHHAIVAGVGVLVALALWLVTGRTKGFALTATTLLILHPAWTISALSGDCGFMKAAVATTVSVAIGVGVAAQAGLLILKPKQHNDVM